MPGTAAKREAEAAEIDDAPTIFVRKAAPPPPAPGSEGPGHQVADPQPSQPAPSDLGSGRPADSAPEGVEASPTPPSEAPTPESAVTGGEVPASESAATGDEASAAPESQAQAGSVPVAPEVDGGSATADAAVSEREAGVGEPATTQLPAAEPPAAEPPAAEPPAPALAGDEPTQQFAATSPTRQMPQWGGVPQQPAPGQHDPQPAAQGQPSPQASVPQQQWGTVPAAGGQFGAPPAGPPQGVPQQGMQQPGMQQPGMQQPGMPPPQGGSYSAAPPPGSGPQFGGPSSSQQFHQAGPFGPGDTPQQKNRTPLIVGGIVGVIILALLVVLGVRLIGGDDQATDADPSPSVTAPSTDPAGDPTTPAQTDDPTDDPSDQPSDDPSDPAGSSTGNVAALAPGEAAIVNGTGGEPEVEVALVSVQRNWEPEGSQAMICPDPEGEYIAMEFEFTTLPALADGAGTYSFVGFEVGLANDNGTALEANGVSGLFCLGSDQQAPTEMGPGETHTGWAVIDAPAEATQVLWQPWLDFTGEQPTYAWSMADF